MKTTSYLKITVLAMTIAGTSSAVFAATSDSLSISALVANVAAVKFGPALSFGIQPNGSGGNTLTGNKTTSMCVYSSTGSAKVTISSTSGGYLIGSKASNTKKIPYQIMNTTTGMGMNLDMNNLWEQTLSGLDTKSDCSGAVAPNNNFVLTFGLSFTYDGTLPMVDTYADTINASVIPV